MSGLSSVILIAWVPVVLLLFRLLQPREAIITSFLAAWMFLPVTGIPLAGLPDYTKVSATCGSVALALLLFDFRRLSSFRPCWVDVPMLVWCLVDLPTSISNDLGVYDGLAGVLGKTIGWGVPFIVGRLYLSRPADLRALAIAIVVGGLAYVPLCLWEVVMSPNLHHSIYGFHPHRFAQAIRGGGYRPMVFMRNGLMVAMWMAATAVTSFWLWRVAGMKRLYGVPMSILVITLSMTTVLCKSLGSMALLAAGVGTASFTAWTRSRLLLFALLALPPLYIGVRTTEVWSGRGLVELVRTYVGEERASSFEGRLEQEELFCAKAWQRPAFGWGGYRRMRPTDEVTGEELTRGVDSLWVIALGSNGLVGLIAWASVMLVPPAMFLWRYPTTERARALVAAPAALVLIVILYTIDCLANGLVNPIFILTTGGLAGYVSNPTSQYAYASLRKGASGYRRREEADRWRSR